MKFRYQCSECGLKYDLDPQLTTCPACRKNQKADEPLRGVLEVRLEGDLPSSGNLIQNMLPYRQNTSRRYLRKRRTLEAREAAYRDGPSQSFL